MPRITRSKQGQSIGSSTRSKGSRALADISSNAPSRRNPTNDGSKPTKKRSGKTSKQIEPRNDTDAAIDELGRRITRSMTLASEPENSSAGRSSSAKHTSRRRARLAALPDPSTMRVTRSMALRDKRLTASKIPIDTVANIATYLEPNDEAMNVCLAVGPKGARIVRRRYLIHDKCDNWSQSSTEFLFSALKNNKSKGRREQVVFQWMRYNNKWRSFMFSKDYSFDAPLVVKKDENRSEFCLVPMFANPGVAASLELTFLVKTHCLRDDFDVNGFYTIRITSEDSTDENSARIHLAYAAMLNDDVDTFDALAAQPSIDFGSISKYGDKFTFLIQSSMAVGGKNSPHFLRTIVNHRATDVNAPNLHASPNLLLTPLQWLLLSYGNTEMFESSPRWALEILLEAGADASLASVVEITPSEIALALATRSVTEDNIDKYNRYLEALTAMREWPASMKINGLVRGFLVRRRLAGAAAAQE